MATGEFGLLLLSLRICFLNDWIDWMMRRDSRVVRTDQGMTFTLFYIHPHQLDRADVGDI